MGSIHYFSTAFHSLSAALSAHFHPVVRQRCCSQGVQAGTPRRFFGTRLLCSIVFPSFWVLEVERMGSTLKAELLTMEPKLQPWLEHMVPAVLSLPVGLIWMEPPRKGRFCRGMRSSAPVSFSFFLARPGFWLGLGTADWTANSWSIQSRLLPCRNPPPRVLQAWLVDTHQHTDGDLACRPAFLCPLLAHLCPLAGFLVWIWWRFNERIDSVKCRLQVQSKRIVCSI